VTSGKPSSLADRITTTLRLERATDFKPGDKLSGMHALRQRVGVSINTIGAALDILASEGLLDKRRGSGVYVSDRVGRLRIGILSQLDLFDPGAGEKARLSVIGDRQTRSPGRV